MVTALGRTALGIALGVVVLAALVPGAGASAPAVPPGCASAITATAPTNTTDVSIPDNGTAVTSTIDVTGVSFAFDVDVTTKITHTFPGDLDVTLTSPGGAVVTLTTDNGGANDNVFNGTTWDDDADPGSAVPYSVNPSLVTDHTYANNVVAPSLVPEEGLSLFVDGPASGTWTLTIVDDAAGGTGTLDEWSLNIKGSNTSAVRNPAEVHASSNNTSVPITTGAPPQVVNSQINVSGAGSYLSAVQLFPSIPHTSADNLDITLTSHSGTVVTLSTDNGGSNDDVFSPAIWSETANFGGQIPYTNNPGLTTDHPYANLTSAGNLTPEESLGAFIGEGPNGNWTLSVSDDTTGDGGSIAGWTLILFTTTCVDLQTNLTVDRDPAVVGNGMTYSLNAINRSPTTALGNPTVSLPLPTGITFTSLATPAGWSCTTPPVGAGGTISCNKATMAAGQSATFVVQALPTAAAAGIVSATGAGAVSPPDEIPVNDSQVVSSTVFLPSPSPANPPPIPNCDQTVTSATNTSDVAIPSGPAVVTSTLDVTGAQPYLTDVDALTKITHTFPDDLDMTLTSPAGTVVTLTTDNGSSANDQFNGTTWDDDADPGSPVPYTANDGVVSDRTTFVNNQAIPRLVPEEAMGAFIGENPNGTWTLTVSDDAGGDSGTIDEWSLTLAGQPGAPPETTGSATNPADVAIPTVGTPTVTSSVTVSGAGPYLTDVDALTEIAHTSSGQLDVTVRSPQGTEVTLTTDNGGSNDNVFNGTTWDDDANPGGQVPYSSNAGLVSDHTFTNNVVASPLVPEEAMAAFIGEDPNGSWTLRVFDDTSGTGGTVGSFGLNFKTTSGCPKPLTGGGGGNPPPLARLAASSLTMNPVRFRAKLRGVSISRARRPVVRRRPPFGTRIGYRLTVAASARFTVERVLPGRRVGRRCVKPTRLNARRARCTRYVALRGAFTHSGKAGANSLRFSGRLNGRKLAPGRYRLTVRASAAGGRRAGPLRKLFTIAP